MNIHYRHIVLFFSIGLVAGLVLSPVAISVGMISLLVLAIFQLDIVNWVPRFQFNFTGYRQLQQWRNYPVYAILTLFFWIVVVRFWPIVESEYLLQRLRIKIPFLLLPIAFLCLPRFRLRQVFHIHYFLLVLLSITSIGVLANYWQHYEEINELIRQGHHIPTPRNHIRYSLLLAWAIIGGLYLSEQTYYWRWQWERWLIRMLTLFLFIAIHLLVVKSGIVVLYVGLVVWAIRYLVVKRSWALGLLMLGSVAIAPTLAYQYHTGFRNKVIYFIHDMKMFGQGEGQVYSDSGRIVSLMAGWDIAKRHWLLGVGTANKREAIRQYYGQHYPDYVEFFMTQNQFLYAWAAQGLIGLFGTIIAFFYPLFYRQHYRHSLLLAFYATMFTIITIEHAFENAVGVAHFLFFLLIMLSYLHHPAPLPVKAQRDAVSSPDVEIK